MLVHVQHLGFANNLSNAGKICRQVIIQHFSPDFLFLKKIKSNLAKSNSWSTERKYFGRINESFSCVLTGIGFGVTNLTVLQHPTMLSLGCYSKSTEKSTWMCHLFCCRVNTHTIHRATQLSHRFATIPQSLEICLFMQKIGSFLNPSHRAVAGSWEVPQTCKGFGFSHPSIRTCCCLAEPLSNWAFGNFSKSVRDCEKMPPGVCITLPHTVPVSQLPSTLGETILNVSICCRISVGEGWDEQQRHCWGTTTGKDFSFVVKIKILSKNQNMLINPGCLCYNETRRLPSEPHLLEVFC